MKTRSFPLSRLAFALAGMAIASQALAADTVQTWRYNFTGTSSPANGSYPYWNNLVLASDGNYYGTTRQGGANNYGTIFRLTPGGAMTTIYSFPGGAAGCYPTGGLGLNQAGALVGIASDCGSSGTGTVFRSSLSGVVVTLYTFTSSTDGYNNSSCTGRAPLLRSSDNYLVGVNCYGGTFGYGTVWELAPNGRFKVLKAFNESWDDGLNPRDIALDAEEGIVGVTDAGGTGGQGTIFKIAPDGTYSQLYDFTYQGHNGQNPQGIAVGSDGAYYGVANDGGQFGYGTVFQFANNKIKTLHHVYHTSLMYEGYGPYGKPVIDANGNIWGTTYNSGAIFRVTKAGVYTTMYKFGTDDGENPDGTIALAGNSIYATTRNGGANDRGSAIRFAVGANPAAATITATPARVQPGGQVAVKWKGTNVNSCSATGNAGGGWTGTLAKSGTMNVTAPNTPGRYYYWVGCAAASGNNYSSQIAEITVAP